MLGRDYFDGRLMDLLAWTCPREAFANRSRTLAGF